MPLSESLEFILSANPSGAISAFESVAAASQKSLSSAESNIGKIGATLAKLGAGGIGVGGLLTQIGSTEEAAANQLRASISQAGETYADFQGRVDSAIQSQVRFGNTNHEVQSALATLVGSFGDTNAALDRMQLVTDLAARKHIDLTDAASIVARVHGGATRVLKEFNIQVQQNADGTKNYDGALDQLAQKLQGQAAASADTATGKFKALKAEVENIASDFGERFGPAILASSTILTAAGSAVAGFAAIQGRLSASREAEAAAALRQAQADAQSAAAIEAETASIASAVEANAAYAASSGERSFSDAEVAAAMQARQAADAQALIGQGALIAADEAEAAAATELAAAESAAAAAAAEQAAAQTGAATATTGLAGASAAGATSTGGLLSTLAGFGPVIAPLAVALPLIKIGLDGNTKAEQEAAAATQAYTQALEQQTGASSSAVDAVTAQQLATTKAGREVVNAGIDMQTFFASIRRGVPGLHDLDTALIQSSGSAVELGGKLHDAARGGDPLIVMLDQLYSSGHLTTEQLLAIVGKADDMSGSFSTAASQSGALATGLASVDASGADVTKQLKAIDDQAKVVTDSINSAAEAAHQLLPAELQAKYAPIDIGDAEARVTEAQKKLADAQAGTAPDTQKQADATLAAQQAQKQYNDALASGDTLKQAEAQNALTKAQQAYADASGKGPDPAAVAQAQRDLDRAQQDVNRAVLNGAQANEQLSEAQAGANGQTVTGIDKNNFLLQGLQAMEQYVSGPYLTALQNEETELRNINSRLEEQDALNKQIAQDAAAQAGLTAEQLQSAAYHEQYTPPGTSGRLPDQPTTGRAVGGAIRPGEYLVGEQGPERLSISATGQGWVWDTRQTSYQQAAQASAAGGSSEPINVGGITVYGTEPVQTAQQVARSLRRMAMLRPR